MPVLAANFHLLGLGTVHLQLLTAVIRKLISFSFSLLILDFLSEVSQALLLNIDFIQPAPHCMMRLEHYKVLYGLLFDFRHELFAGSVLELHQT